MPHVDEGGMHAYLDGECTAAERIALEDHLRGCESCRSLIEDAAATRSLAAQLVGELAPEVDAPGWHEMLDRAGQSALQAPRSPRTWRRDLAWAATLVMAFGLGWQANREFAPGASNRPREIRLAEPAQKQGAELTEGTLAPPTSAVGPAPDDRFERSSRVNEPAPSLAAVADEAADDIAAAQPARRAERAAAPEPLSAAARSVVGAEEGLRAAARPDESVSGEVRGGALVADLQERRLALADREEDRLAAGRLPAPPQAIASAGIARPPSEAEAAVAVRDFRASDELASRNELTASSELAAIDALAAEDWLGAPPLQLVGTGTVDVSVGPGGGLPDAARGRPVLRYRYVLEGGAQVTLLQQYVGSMADEAADLDVVDASAEFRQLEAPRRQGWRASSSLEDAVFSVHPDGDYMLRWQDRLGYLVWLRGDTDEASLRRLAAAVR